MIGGKTPQVVLEIPIQDLNLVVSLRMIGATMGQHSPMKFEYLPPKITHKVGSRSEIICNGGPCNFTLRVKIFSDNFVVPLGYFATNITFFVSKQVLDTIV